MKPASRLLLAAVIGLPLVGGATLLARASSAQEPAIPRIVSGKVARVQLAVARASGQGATGDLTGTLVPARALQVGFELGGRLERVQVHKGERVKAGQVLGELNSEMADAQLHAAEAALHAAEAQAENAADVASRMDKLKASGSATDMQERGATLTSRAAAAQVEAARAQLAQARAARSRHVLRAPFAGTIIEAPEQTGATVGPGSALFTLEQLDPLVLRLTVPEATVGALRVGAHLGVAAVGSAAHSSEATIRLVLPSADATTHRIPVELSVPNPEGRFVAHTLAHAQLPVASGEGTQTVPASALAMAGGDHVLVLENGLVRRVDVEVLSRTASEVTLRAPRALEKVIDAPPEELQPGSPAELR
jgi:membrane fusion protein (multidrug efflux system)